MHNTFSDTVDFQPSGCSLTSIFFKLFFNFKLLSLCWFFFSIPTTKTWRFSINYDYFSDILELEFCLTLTKVGWLRLLMFRPGILETFNNTWINSSSLHCLCVCIRLLGFIVYHGNSWIFSSEKKSLFAFNLHFSNYTLK